MKYGPLVFLAAFFALSTSWFGFVLKPQADLGRAQQETNVVSSLLYPQPRPGQARQGVDVYRADGCFYCHSQQVGQTGVACDVVLTSPGTNLTAAAEAVVKANPMLARANLTEFLSKLPATVLKNITRDEADAALKLLKAPEMKVEVHIVPTGPDITRGWGRRHNVAEDYVYDWPVMLGSQRVGPDLANVGARLPDANWQLLHLYSPQGVVKDSTMPSFRFLFETRKIGRVPATDALQLTGDLAPPAGYEVVPKPEAQELVAYLLSLNSDAPLYEEPFTAPAPAPAQTNSIAAK